MIVNLFGGPGSGKSVMRASVFARLKKSGIKVEEVPEIAKGFVWEERYQTLTHQPYIFGKQLRDLQRLEGKVDVIITDSPILLVHYYAEKGKREYPYCFYSFIRSQAHAMGGLNFFLDRVFPYKEEGRYQKEEEADVVAKEIENTLRTLYFDYLKIPGNEEGENIVFSKILEELQK